jgi:hypothetical protein
LEIFVIFNVVTKFLKTKQQTSSSTENFTEGPKTERTEEIATKILLVFV